MHVYRYMVGVALLVVSIGSAACDESLTDITGPTPNLVPTFSSIQTEIFNNSDSSGRAACTQCHGGHEHVGGGTCEQCHPPEKGRSNSFVVAAAVTPGETIGAFTVPPAAERRWPGATGFSHLSRGHSGPDLECKACHAQPGVAQAKSLADVVIPDENAPACRDCHLKQQFHWR